MRRFLLHVLPGGFHRIRHYGLFANGHRAEMIKLCRQLLGTAEPPKATAIDGYVAAPLPNETPACPCCSGRQAICCEGRSGMPKYQRRMGERHTAGGEPIRHPRDRLTGQPEERQHSAAASGRGNECPPRGA
jgi:Putative transposase